MSTSKHIIKLRQRALFAGNTTLFKLYTEIGSIGKEKIVRLIIINQK